MEHNVQVLTQGEFVPAQCAYWAIVRCATSTTTLFLSAPPDAPAYITCNGEVVISSSAEFVCLLTFKEMKSLILMVVSF